MIGTALLVLASAFATPGRADPALPQVALPLMKTAPMIDGKIDEAEWAGAVRNVGLCSQHNLELKSREAIFWAGSDGRNLYLAMKSELPPGGEILNRAVPDGDRDIMAALNDDSVELVIHPHLGATAGDRRYFHLIVNARGAMFDRSFDEASPQNAINTAWRLKNWQYQSGFADGWWQVEMAIPLAEIGATPEDLKHPWGLRICRNWQRPWDQSRWESVGAPYEDVPTMPRLRFDENAPVVQVLGLRGESKPRIELSVADPGAAPLPAKVFLSDTWSRNPPTELTKDLTVAAGGKELVSFEPPHGGPEGAHHTIIRVTSPDEQRVFYVRDFTWRFERSADRWALTKEDKQAVQLQYKVYPYYRKLKVRVGIDALASKDRVTGAELSFVKHGVDKPVVTAPLSFRDHVAETIVDMPELAEGNYEVRVKLLGGEGVPTDAVVGPYERKVFPWEHNQLGLSDRVIPPFTAITVRGKTLSTVLREHELGGAGLWEQVTSLGRPLLKGPMHWHVEAGGKEIEAKAGSLKVESAKPSFTVTGGSFTAGPLKASVRSEWDLDGMAKVFLTLQPTPGQETRASQRSDAASQSSISRLSLEIPLDDAQMGYMHSCGDGLRFNYAGKTPAGEGPIWDSSKANKTNIVGTFYPYLWVGGGERGLAWFADSDKGWSLDETTPTVQLERRAGVLTMRVNFVTRPTKLDAPREIVFGLQATPAKPMPEQPVNWRRWLSTYYDSPKVQPFSVIGATFYYGLMGDGFYPRDHDLSIYDAFSKARDTGQYDADFVAKWLEGYKAHGVQPGTDLWKHYEAHISAGMRSAAGTPRSQGWLWTPYTNARGMGYDMAEWPTFQDEWVNFPYLERSKSGGLAYDICPVRSLQDASLWYYREMMKCFDGIYWDNIFFAANFDTVAGGAWMDEKGRVHPSMGLWPMRELIKRTAFLFNEMGRPVFANVPHMTNTCIVPILSFANINLDWEWQYGKRDWQDRFSPDLAVAETIGRQCGNVPLVLAGGFYDEKDPAWNWCMRTRLGVCLVHEIRVWDWHPAFHYALLKKLFDFGYGDKACRVYNYWDEGFPLSVTGCDAKGIVMVKGQKAIAIVTDYGEGGTCTMKLDLGKLGLPATVKPSYRESGEALTAAGPGEASFPLKKHDFKAVAWQ